MCKTNKMIYVAIISALVGGLGVHFFKTYPDGAMQYNCELSGGSFYAGACTCPLEGEQTQKEMYDISTGFCQSSMGGPGGDAFSASIGLPWRDYAFWTNIIENDCTKTGGDWLNARCTCDNGVSYDQETGYCE